LLLGSPKGEKDNRKEKRKKGLREKPAAIKGKKKGIGLGAKKKQPGKRRERIASLSSREGGSGTHYHGRENPKEICCSNCGKRKRGRFRVRRRERGWREEAPAKYKDRERLGGGKKGVEHSTPSLGKKGERRGVHGIV